MFFIRLAQIGEIYFVHVLITEECNSSAATDKRDQQVKCKGWGSWGGNCNAMLSGSNLLGWIVCHDNFTSSHPTLSYLSQNVLPCWAPYNGFLAGPVCFCQSSAVPPAISKAAAHWQHTPAGQVWFFSPLVIWTPPFRVGKRRPSGRSPLICTGHAPHTWEWRSHHGN